MTSYHVALACAFGAGVATAVVAMALVAFWPRRRPELARLPLAPLDPPPRRRGELVLLQSTPKERQ